MRERCGLSCGSARFARRTAFACVLPVLVLATRTADATRDRPPPKHTGGFGEPTCHTCHFEHEVNRGAGKVLLLGLPDRYTPGASYALTVVVTEPGLGAGGFQLSARFENGGQAGVLRSGAGEAERSDVTVDSGVQYAHHLDAGTDLVAPDTARWRLVWQAPADAGIAVFHVAANAANDDGSPLGDRVYTSTVRVSAGK